MSDFSLIDKARILVTRFISLVIRFSENDYNKPPFEIEKEIARKESLQMDTTTKVVIRNTDMINISLIKKDMMFLILIKMAFTK